jgi:glycosyltransferase involved in cell wall biosynthesis
MKIHILYKFREGPWGGGNQFLKALRDYLKKHDLYEEDFDKADAVLFSGFPFQTEYYFKKLFRFKRKNPSKLVIYRRDGPISLIRGKDEVLDKILTLFSSIVADGIIFQTEWSRGKNQKLFGMKSQNEAVIFNAPDNTIFNRKGKAPRKEKIKLIATSWSSHWRKGFKVYQYLDEHLDFSKYEMTFVGNSPVEFKNIIHKEPVDSKKLASIIKEHDLFITASKTDPCSNSLIEALSCGLPAVVYNDGGHPELVGKGGEVFNDNEEALKKIELVAKNYKDYQANLSAFKFERAGKEYVDFIKGIFDSAEKNEYNTKQMTLDRKIKFAYMKARVLAWKLKGILEFLMKKVQGKV